jgi:hypothetical protein
VLSTEIAMHQRILPSGVMAMANSLPLLAPGIE